MAAFRSAGWLLMVDRIWTVPVTMNSRLIACFFCVISLIIFAVPRVMESDGIGLSCDSYRICEKDVEQVFGEELDRLLAYPRAEGSLQSAECEPD